MRSRLGVSKASLLQHLYRLANLDAHPGARAARRVSLSNWIKSGVAQQAAHG